MRHPLFPVVLIIPTLLTLSAAEPAPAPWGFRLDVSLGIGRMATDVDYCTEAKSTVATPLTWTDRSQLSQGSSTGRALRADLGAIFSERIGQSPLRLLWGATCDFSRCNGLSITAQVADPDKSIYSQNGQRFICDISSSDLVGGPTLGLGLVASPRWRFSLLGGAGYGISDVTYTSGLALVSGDPVGRPQANHVTGQVRTWTLRLESAWTPLPGKAVTLGLGWTARRTHARYVNYKASLVSNPNSKSQEGIFKEDLEMTASGIVASLGLAFIW